MNCAILFSKPRGLLWQPLSLLIRFFDYKKSLKPFDFFGLYPNSHCAIKFGSYVYESVLFLGCRKIPYNLWLEKNKVNYFFILKIKNPFDTSVFLNSKLGVPYAFMELFGILWKNILRTFFNKIVYYNPITTGLKMKCSEFVYLWLIFEKKIKREYDENLISVRELENLIQEMDNASI